MARPPMRQHSIRCTDEEWAAAQAESDERGETLSEAVREFLRRYARGEGRKGSG